MPDARQISATPLPARRAPFDVTRPTRTVRHQHGTLPYAYAVERVAEATGSRTPVYPDSGGPLATHPDLRIPLALVEGLAHPHLLRDPLRSTLVHRALADADRAGVAWTLLLDRLVDVPLVDSDALHALRPRLRELVRWVRTATPADHVALETMTAFWSEPLRTAVARGLPAACLSPALAGWFLESESAATRLAQRTDLPAAQQAVVLTCIIERLAPRPPVGLGRPHPEVRDWERYGKGALHAWRIAARAGWPITRAHIDALLAMAPGGPATSDGTPETRPLGAPASTPPSGTSDLASPPASTAVPPAGDRKWHMFEWHQQAQRVAAALLLSPGLTAADVRALVAGWSDVHLAMDVRTARRLARHPWTPASAWLAIATHAEDPGALLMLARRRDVASDVDGGVARRALERTRRPAILAALCEHAPADHLSARFAALLRRSPAHALAYLTSGRAPAGFTLSTDQAVTLLTTASPTLRERALIALAQRAGTLTFGAGPSPASSPTGTSRRR
jgi:hypothetical protein